MKRNILSSVIILLTLTLSLSLWCNETFKNNNPNFEFCGVNKFYQIVDILKQNIEPSKEQLDSLFETPGYKRIMKTTEGQVFKNLMMSYMPKNINEKDKWLVKMREQENKFWELFTVNSYETFEYSDKNREGIYGIIDELKKYPYTEVAVKEALNFLPENNVNEFPAVSFVIFPDSRGNDPICMAINNILKNKNNISAEIINKLNDQGYTKERISALSFAHEFFHYYRDKELDFKMPDRNNDDFDLVWIINQIENEGIADQIDKKQLYFGEGCFKGTENSNINIDEQKKQPDMIIALDKLISQAYNNISERKKINQKIRNMIPRAGHPLGFFMANTIIEHLGKDSLIKVVRNPFAFFRLYNKIAENNEMIPEFSKNSIKYISDMEEKYLFDE